MAAKIPAALPHPYVTVEDVWRGALPKGTQLAGGASGSRREVVWCAVLRARSPAFSGLRGGELLLVDLKVLTAVDPRLSLGRVLESLAGQGVAGAAVAGRVSPEARRVADDTGLPLFVLPAGAALDQVEQQVLRYVVDQRAELHERAQDLHRQLSELALAGRGLSALLARLQQLTGIPVVLERDGGLEYVGPTPNLPEEIRAAIVAERGALDDWLREVPLSAFDPPVALRPLVSGRARLIAPILVHGGIAGFLSLVGADGELGELHRLAVGRAAHACAIELVRVRAARDARDEAADELLDLLTAGRAGSDEAARERAKRKGFDVDAAYLAVAASSGGTASRVRGAWERWFATTRTSALVRERGAITLALIGLAGRRPPEPKALVEQLRQAAATASGGPVTMGYGSVRSGAQEVAAAAREAEQALAMGQRLFGPDSATAFSDLGLYRLLFALQPRPELRDFTTEVLGRLRDKDRGGVLLQTLAAYLKTNGSPTDTAERLHLHRNTVLYRLGRIEELLSLDLRDAEVRLSLHLALKIGDVLEA
jgi:PucR family transcriptional regulator, purine catabolism regulatory protein